MDYKRIKARLEELGIHVTAYTEKGDSIFFDWTLANAKRIEDLKNQGVLEPWPLILTKPTHGKTSKASWRQRGAMKSLQIVLHDYGAFEADIDDWNPNWGVGPALIHILQVCYDSIRRLKSR